MKPQLLPGRKYSFATSAGKVTATIVEAGDEWVHGHLEKGDPIWLRVTSISGVVELNRADQYRSAWTETAPR